MERMESRSARSCVANGQLKVGMQRKISHEWALSDRSSRTVSPWPPRSESRPQPNFGRSKNPSGPISSRQTYGGSMCRYRVTVYINTIPCSCNVVLNVCCRSCRRSLVSSIFLHEQSIMTDRQSSMLYSLYPFQAQLPHQ